jgi:uncharacterized oxidoreductase
MKTTGKTVLITGGGSGIGFQLAKLFSEQNNKVIITGRTEQKLKDAAAQLKNTDYFVGDVASEEDTAKLVELIGSKYGKLDILVNNAAVINFYNLGPDAGAYKIAADEIRTNYLAVVNLTEKLLPILGKQDDAAIVNINAILGLAPSFFMPTHSASKAALRSYTQVLRFSLEKAGSTIKVIEVLPPLVATEFSKAIGSLEKGMPASAVAEAILEGLKNDIPVIAVGPTDKFYQAFFANSEQAVTVLNQLESK